MLTSDYVKAAAEMFCVHPRDLTGPYKFQFLLLPRFALSKALRMRGWTLPRIARLVNRDHTTVMYQIKQAELHMSRDAGYAAKVNALAELQIDLEPVKDAA